MLFNSYAFILVYLPITLAVFFLLGACSRRWAAAWLFLASLCFYGWWDASYLPLLLGSIVFNFCVGSAITRAGQAGRGRRKKLLFIIGIVGDLGLLAYFKYAGFIVANLNLAFDTHWSIGAIVLPLGISFFTFTQIAFLVDAYRSKAAEYNPIHYGLFVTYFPHLIAGPILHHKEMMPQFDRASVYRPNWNNIAVGTAIFAIGLFKKAVIADSLAPQADAVFAAADAGAAHSFLHAWGGALSYAFQLYFDFSGYCDMAIGLSYMIGVRLPLNFASPYKSGSIVEFWRRWHMTLSRFLRDYLYFPLGGNRRGPARRWLNLLITMVLGGLWHGAAWTFVIWGFLHGLYLVVNHAWSELRDKLPWRRGPAERFFGWALTFVAVVVAWVPFRATSLDGALRLLDGMSGGAGVALPGVLEYRLDAAVPLLGALGVAFDDTSGTLFATTWTWIAVAAAVAFFAPNTQEIMARYSPALERIDRRQWPRLAWRLSAPWAVATAIVLAAGILSLPRVTTFLYFQF